MRNLKRMGAMMMALVLAFSLSVTAFAAVEDTGFADVAADAWYAEAVEYVRDNGLMSGTSATTFAPNDTMTRSMLATTLYREAGSPAVSGGDAEFDQQIGRLVGEFAHVVEGEAFFFAPLVCPDHGQFIAVASGPFVDYIISEVVVFRCFDGEVGGNFLRTNLFFGGSFHFLDITSMVVFQPEESSLPVRCTVL